MIRLVPIDPPWEESQAFGAAFHEAMAQRIETDLKRQIVPSSGIFTPEPEEAHHEPLSVEHDEESVTVTIEPSEHQQETIIATQVKQAVQEASRDLPMDQVREAVIKAEPPFASTF